MFLFVVIDPVPAAVPASVPQGSNSSDELSEPHSLIRKRS